MQLPRDSGVEIGEENIENGHDSVKGSASQSNHGIVESPMPDNTGLKSVSPCPLWGLTRSFWSKNDKGQC